MNENHIYNGEVFGCGCEFQKHEGKLATYASSSPIYTMEQLAQFEASGFNSIADWVWCVLNQGSEGDCWRYMAIGAAMTKINIQYRQKVYLDMSIGIVLTGQYSGGSIDSSIVQVDSVYGMPTAEFMGTDPLNAVTKRSKRQWPDGWEKNAALRIVPKGGWRQTGDAIELASAIKDGNPGGVGMDWEGNPRKGHALQVAEYRIIDGVIWFGGPNSWGLRDSGGWGAHPERKGWWLVSSESVAMRRTFRSYGAYALCEVKNAAVPEVPSHGRV